MSPERYANRKGFNSPEINPKIHLRLVLLTKKKTPLPKHIRTNNKMTKEINEIPVRFLSTIFDQFNSPWTESISPWWTDAREGSGESMPGEEFHAREFPRLEYHFYEISIEGEGGKLTRWPSLFPGVEWTALNAMTSFPTSFPVPGAASYPSSVPLTRNFSWIEGRSFIPSHSTDYEWIFCIRVARHWKKILNAVRNTLRSSYASFFDIRGSVNII